MTARPLVVVGDVLLDVDLVGSTGRVSPDAPALVVDRIQERPRPGGAGLAAFLAARDGRDVVLVAPIGGDEDGARLRGVLAAHGVELLALPWTGSTPVKSRVRAGGQTLVRLDTGDGPGMVGSLPGPAAETLRAAGAVLVSDYGRGTTSATSVREALHELPRSTPVVWDPHPRGAAPVPRVHLATPNQAEAELFCAESDFVMPAEGSLAGVHAAASHLVRAWQAQAVAVTLGARGALLSYGEGTPLVMPADRVAGADTCGAGDSFAAAAACCLADGGVLAEAVTEAVEAAGRFVAEGGASGLSERTTSVPSSTAGTVVATGGCFDLLHAGHVATLEAARSLGDHLVVLLNSDASVRRLKGPGRPIVGQHDRARVLQALECVDEVVIFSEDTPVEALRALRPDVWAKGGDYAGAEVPENAVLAEWGGQSVVLPYLQGRSTTDLVHTAVARATHVPVARKTTGDDGEGAGA